MDDEEVDAVTNTCASGGGKRRMYIAVMQRSSLHGGTYHLVNEVSTRCSLYEDAILVLVAKVEHTHIHISY